MNGNDPGQEAPPPEMRLAANELARLTATEQKITEQEMAAFYKVAALLASRGLLYFPPPPRPPVGMP